MESWVRVESVNALNFFFFLFIFAFVLFPIFIVFAILLNTPFRFFWPAKVLFVKSFEYNVNFRAIVEIKGF